MRSRQLIRVSSGHASHHARLRTISSAAWCSSSHSASELRCTLRIAAGLGKSSRAARQYSPSCQW
eukprot:9363158-Pyramimonas_sp.AAC.1